MISFHITTFVLGASFAACILLLIRRDHLCLKHGVFWFTVAACALLLGAVPSLIDHLAGLIGISHSPSFLLLSAVIILLIKVLLSDIEQTRIDRQLRRLNQRLAMYEADNERDSEQPNL